MQLIGRGTAPKVLGVATRVAGLGCWLKGGFCLQSLRRTRLRHVHWLYLLAAVAALAFGVVHLVYSWNGHGGVAVPVMGMILVAAAGALAFAWIRARPA